MFDSFTLANIRLKERHQEKKTKFINQFELHKLLESLKLDDKISWDWLILLIAKSNGLGNLASLDELLITSFRLNVIAPTLPLSASTSTSTILIFCNDFPLFDGLHIAQFAPVTFRQSCNISHCVSLPHIFRIVS